jgi:hypothetical protein
METGSRRETLTLNGLLRIEDCLDTTGKVVLPPGTTLVSLIDGNAANAGDLVAYRYLDHSRSVDGEASEVTWFVATVEPAGEATVAYFDRRRLGAGHRTSRPPPRRLHRSCDGLMLRRSARRRTSCRVPRLLTPPNGW